jgi:hypothetical protein
VITSPVQCQYDCERYGDPRYCNGINVVPLHNDRNVYFKGINLIPWDDECKDDKVHFTYAPNNTLVCFGVQARERTDVITQYEVTDDPEDAMFFSSCYVRSLSWEFQSITQPAKPQATPWVFADQCISCEAAATNYHANFSYSPRWATSEQCVNCDQFPAAPAIVNNGWELIVDGGECDGNDDWWKESYWNNTLKRSVYYHHTCPETTPRQDLCTKTLVPINSYYAMKEECWELASRDRECGEHVMYYDSQYYDTCRCYLKKPCCKKCSVQKRNAAWSLYKLQKFSLPPDPTCARGVTDSSTPQACCEPTCKQCGSTIDTFTNTTVLDCKDLIGACCPYMFPNRRCSTSSAPCMMN